MSDAVKLDSLVVNTIKTLAIDAVQAANSGHPGMPMGMADTASVLWREFLVTDPRNPSFCDRDRFILSAGHGSMLLYGLLHLSGHDLSLEQLKNFRQMGSLTPGHPEFGLTAGVETTTGPLGQGFANGVGMAMAEAHLASVYNRPGHTLVDHYVYGICSDGDLQEGLSHEAAAIAGHLKLGKLIFLYDDNEITIDGCTANSSSTDETVRFESHGWQVLSVDGHDRAAVREALVSAKGDTSRPTLIRCRTYIGHGSPNKEGSEKSHGSPLGAEEVRLTKEKMGWPVDAQFLVPPEVPEAFSEMRMRGASKRDQWLTAFDAYKAAYPSEATEFLAMQSGDVDVASLKDVLAGIVSDAPQATRASSGKVINALASLLPSLIGGSADLAGSNKTTIEGAAFYSPATPSGRNIHFGIREHGMAAAMNGMALHGGLIPYGGTFLTFSDYMRPSMRLAALMKQRVVYVLTHDSIFLGEDGPTHQSVEHAMALRLIPGLDVMRPADMAETAAAWLATLGRNDGPTALLLTRQNLPQLVDFDVATTGIEKGGYVIAEQGLQGEPVILIGTGSELHLCVEAKAILESKGVPVRVVSMPCLDRFLRADRAYRDSVLPPSFARRVSVEAGRTFGWESVVGLDGASVGIDSFGESAPAEELAKHFGFTVENVVKTAMSLTDQA
jgi:transketolase